MAFAGIILNPSNNNPTTESNGNAFIQNVLQQENGLTDASSVRYWVQLFGKGNFWLHLYDSAGSLLGKQAIPGNTQYAPAAEIRFVTGGTQTFTDGASYATYDPADDEEMSIVVTGSGNMQGVGSHVYLTTTTSVLCAYFAGNGWNQMSMALKEGEYA
jgi:hypothetical protein